MAHKTLINGTSYNIVGGSTLIDGTSYRISAGKTLIGGTAYSIPIVSSAPGVKFDWGADGDIVDAQWFADLKQFCEEAQPEDVEASIPIGGWKTVQLESSSFGSATHYISVIGINQDCDVGVTFWDTPSTQTYTSGPVNYDAWWTTTTGPQAKISTWLSKFPGTDSLLEVTKQRYNAQSGSNGRTYAGNPSIGVVKGWLPSYDELQGQTTPQENGFSSGMYNPATFSLVESDARYSWPPTKFSTSGNYRVISRTAMVSSTGASNQNYTLAGSANDPTSTLGVGSYSGYLFGACFCVGRNLPSIFDTLDWDKINDLCIDVQEGGSWPAGVKLGLRTDWHFSSAVLGETSIPIQLVGIDQDQPGTLTFITDAFTTSAPFGSGVYQYVKTADSGARQNCQLFYDNSVAKSYIRPIGRIVQQGNSTSTNTTDLYLLGDWAYIPSMKELGFGSDDKRGTTPEGPVADNTQTTADPQNASPTTRGVTYRNIVQASQFGSQSQMWTRSRVAQGGGEYYMYTITSKGAQSTAYCSNNAGYRILFTIGTKYPGQRIYY